MIFCNKCGGTLNAAGLCLDCGAQAFPSAPVTRPAPSQVGESPDGFPAEPMVGPQTRSSFPTGVIVVVIAVIGFPAIAVLIYFAASSVSRPVRSNPTSISTNTSSTANGTPDFGFPNPSPSPSRSVENQPSPITRNPLSESFQRDYQGSTGHGRSLKFSLERSGSTLGGTASSNGGWDRLSGTIDTNGHFTLRGYETGSDRVTGIYEGRIHADGTISGNWTSTEKGQRTTFKLRQQE